MVMMRGEGRQAWQGCVNDSKARGICKMRDYSTPCSAQAFKSCLNIIPFNLLLLEQ